MRDSNSSLDCYKSIIKLLNSVWKYWIKLFIYKQIVKVI